VCRDALASWFRAGSRSACRRKPRYAVGFGLFDAYAQAQVAGAETWQEELRRYLCAHMAFARENPELYQLCFERPVPGFAPSQVCLALSFGVLSGGRPAGRIFRRYATGGSGISGLHGVVLSAGAGGMAKDVHPRRSSAKE
jgi:hypothetical protein